MMDLTWCWCCVKGIQGCSKEPAGRELLRLKESLSLKSLHQKQKLQMIYQLGSILLKLFFLCSSQEESPEKKKKKRRKRTPVSESSDEGSKSDRYNYRTKLLYYGKLMFVVIAELRVLILLRLTCKWMQIVQIISSEEQRIF